MNDYTVKLTDERTNNVCESYHSTLWREINTCNPQISIIVKYFIEEEFLNRKLVSEISTGSNLASNLV